MKATEFEVEFGASSAVGQKWPLVDDGLRAPAPQPVGHDLVRLEERRHRERSHMWSIQPIEHRLRSALRAEHVLPRVDSGPELVGDGFGELAILWEEELVSEQLAQVSDAAPEG